MSDANDASGTDNADNTHSASCAIDCGGDTLFVKLKKLIVQFFKFGIVGLSNTVISRGILFVFIFINKDLYKAGIVAGWVIGVANSFFWNSRYVFEKTDKSWVSLLLKNYGAYALTLLLELAMSHAEVEWLRIPHEFLLFINMPITVPLNFFIQKFWVYRKRPVQVMNDK